MPDVKLVEPVHQALAGRDLLPDEHYPDSGCASAELIVGARAAFGITLVTPLLTGTSRQYRENADYQREAFAIDWDARQATCPQGATSRFWSPARQKGRDVVVVRFDQADCGPSPVRAICTNATRWGRQLTLRPRALHELIHANHTAQQDQAWQAKYALRAGVEVASREVVQRYGVHDSAGHKHRQGRRPSRGRSGGREQHRHHPRDLDGACRRRGRPERGGPDSYTTWRDTIGVEGTIRQAIAVTGSRRARYRGLATTHLEHVYSAVALNLIRLDAWWNGQPLDHTRTSHLARLDLTLAA
ncbi:hypothetical protein SRB17_88670 [Streptomyces sp. RB17]|nr:hypothetical protein [Streptomyces sp. RB17]